jgi:hypothetical protein
VANRRVEKAKDVEEVRRSWRGGVGEWSGT